MGCLNKVLVTDPATGIPYDDTNPLPVSLSTSPTITIGKVDQGDAAVTAKAWPIKVTDGTNAAAIVGTALKVDGSAVTQPVSGTVSIAPNQSVNLNQIAGTATATGNGVAGSGVQRVTIASDNSAIPVSVSKIALTPASPTAATIGTSSGTAVSSNSSRKGLVLTNTSNNIISLGLGVAAVLNSGIWLVPSGGVWVMDEYTFTTGAINAIASAASSNLAIQEFN